MIQSFEYIQFLQGLVDTTGPGYLDTRDINRGILGIDM